MYSEQEKLEFQKIMEAFGDYLNRTTALDILYSSKFDCYLKIRILDGEPEMMDVVSSARELFRFLCHSIVSDYLEQIEDGFDHELTEKDKLEIEKILQVYTAKLPSYEFDLSIY